MNRRDTHIDILKFIGIVCIILAHTDPKNFIFELRNFDVVLMVMLTGVTFCLSNNKHISYGKYVSKRFRRLIVPTWIFLSIFFVIFIFFSKIAHIPYPFDIEKIIRSYLLIDGIGYVWIMRIYFLTSLLLPLLSWLSGKVKRNVIYFLTLIPVYFLYYGLIELGGLLNNELASELYQCFVIDVIGWGIIVAVGVRVKKLYKKELLLFAGLFLTTYIAFKHIYDFAPTQNYKYPPQIYYISYGLFVSFLLLILLENRFLNKIFGNKVFTYIARNSLWIYLWHIIPVYIIKYFGDTLSLVNYNCTTKFIFVFSISFLLTYIQNCIFNPKRR